MFLKWLGKKWVGGFRDFVQARRELKAKRRGDPPPLPLEVTMILKMLIPFLLKLDFIKGHRREVGFGALFLGNILMYLTARGTIPPAISQTPLPVINVDLITFLNGFGAYTGIVGTVAKNKPAIELGAAKKPARK
jgi:hypothetical protein